MVAAKQPAHEDIVISVGAPSPDISSDRVGFASGTWIRTLNGDVRVEFLMRGDAIVTTSGAPRPIRWIGRRMIDHASHPKSGRLRPIRIAAGAFGDGRPCRDLTISPHHAVAVTCIEEVLLPVRLLVNGSTIAPIDAGTMEFWLVELDSHDVLFANGLPVESCIDVGNHRRESEPEGVVVLHPAHTPEPVENHCRRVILGGPVLAGIRARLEAITESTGFASGGRPIAAPGVSGRWRRRRPGPIPAPESSG